jgi:hypothetical protein
MRRKSGLCAGQKSYSTPISTNPFCIDLYTFVQGCIVMLKQDRSPPTVSTKFQRKVQKIVKDSSHPSHRLFSLLPQASGTGASSLGPKGSLINSVYPRAIRLLNNLIEWPLRLFTLSPLPPLFLHCCYSMFIFYA